MEDELKPTQIELFHRIQALAVMRCLYEQVIAFICTLVSSQIFSAGSSDIKKTFFGHAYRTCKSKKR